MEQELKQVEVPQVTTAAPPRPSMWRWMLETPRDWTALVLRVTLGVMVFPHGAQKVFGWFGGYGMNATIGYFQQLGIPPWLGYLDIAAEFLGSIALVLGFLGRLSALGIGVVMVVASALVVLPNKTPFVDLSFGFHVLALAMAIAIMIRGSGALSIDRALTAKAAS